MVKDPNYIFIKNAILDYYYVPSNIGSTKFSYILDNGHKGTLSNSDKIVALMWYNEAGQKQIFEIADNGEIKKLNSTLFYLYKKANLKLDVDNPNSSGIYGYNERKKSQYKFHVVNKLDGKYTSEMEKSKKTKRKGAVCGTAKGAKDKKDLINLVKTLIDSMIPDNTLDKYKKFPSPRKYKIKNLIDKNLCEEIEILLRHRDSIYFCKDFVHSDTKFKIISHNHRYFYRLEEKNLINKSTSND